ncbi:hypothetical protein ILUMI_13205 [Ignelater luminosus]|uniref:Carboxylic ester hydrolase n=1 Tax=Ignelater luminosus TaxID=2038154 RepID=A0A8K0CWN7_IGNLU|nr:hypothetical protein ILUMI_13205 [Ignelater luminosus]
MLLQIIVIISLLNYITCNDILAPETQIPQGILRGQYLKTSSNREISAYTGIPYAEPPVGNLRFELPQPPKPWNGTFNASLSHPVCPQINIALGGTEVVGDEDCLYLNVYTPQRKFHECKTIPLLPVMMHIHGGAFFLGDCNLETCNPTHLLNKDIVLVTLNYRLGPLGFLSTGDVVSSGNIGLKDQNMAIRWVKANIVYFGGDPDRITLSGQSAGGASAHFHMLSPLSKNLIKGVISESGTAFVAWALDSNNQTIRNTLKLASSFNCSIESSDEILKCLKKTDAYEITRRQHTFYKWQTDPFIPFRPVIEEDIKGAFLPAHPSKIIKSGKAAKIPFMTGITTEDGAMKSPGFFAEDLEVLKDFNANFSFVAPYTFLYHDTSPDPEYVTTKIKSYYFENQTLTNSSFSRAALTDIFTDTYFLSGAYDAVLMHFNHTRQPVYYYAFGYRGAISHSELFGKTTYNFGVCHADELLYLFDPKSLFPNYEPTSIDRGITDILTTLWTNFVITGNPTPVTNNILPSKWEPVQSENLEYYFIKNVTHVKMEKELFWDRIRFWKSLPID